MIFQLSLMLAVVLSIVFAVLKVNEAITWPWFYVALPAIIWVAVQIVFFVVWVVFYGLIYLLISRND